MKTAIILVTTWVIAVIGILAFFRGCFKNKEIQKEESFEWARKWNEARKKDICDNDCLWCSNSQFCKVKDGE